MQKSHQICKEDQRDLVNRDKQCLTSSSVWCASGRGFDKLKSEHKNSKEADRNNQIHERFHLCFALKKPDKNHVRFGQNLVESFLCPKGILFHFFVLLSIMEEEWDFLYTESEYDAHKLKGQLSSPQHSLILNSTLFSKRMDII